MGDSLSTSCRKSALLCMHTLYVFKIEFSNDAVLGEYGRFPMHIVAYKRCLNYWLKLLRMPDDRYVKNGT